MNPSLVTDQVRRFQQLINGQEHLVNPRQAIQQYLNHFPHYEIEKQIKTVPILFHRQWIRTSLKGHLRDVKRSFNKANVYNELYGRRALAWLQQAEKLFSTIDFFTSLSQNHISEHILTADQLQLGDLVLSYKTKGYLKKSIVSSLVRLASNSPITHAMIACHEDGDEPTLLVSGDMTEGLGTVSPVAKPGEILLILRLNQSALSPQILEEIRKWRTLALSRVTDPLLKKEYPFPELKLQTASLLGLFVVGGIFLGLPISPPNPFHKRAGVYCSELIDTIFYRKNILLTPRSTHRAIVSPIEILYSPYFTLKGIICQEEDYGGLQAEIRDQFFIE